MKQTGAIDTSFGDNGFVTTNVAGGMDFPDGIAVQPDARLSWSASSGFVDVADQPPTHTALEFPFSSSA